MKKNNNLQIYQKFKLIIKIISILFSFVITLSFSDNRISPPTGLLCELLRFPESAAITDSIPEFSWIVPYEVAEQKSYQILVASSKFLLDKNKADFWNSGIVLSSNSININYDGHPLLENSTYWWKVKIFDSKNRESDFSEAQQFHTSVFKKQNDEWLGQSNFVKLPNNTWVSENRQTSTIHKISPKIFNKTSSQKWFADFDKAAFASLELEITADNNNDSITIFLGERKNEDLTVNKNKGKSNIGYEKFSLKLNKGLHKYKIEIPTHHSNSPNHQKLPPFSIEVMPFRFVEIIVENKNVDIKQITQLALFYPFNDSSSDFECSDTNLNKVWELCKYTLKATPFLGIYADGNRERMPYEADAYIQQLGHYSVDREFSVARYSADFLVYNPSWPTEWHMHSIMIAWNDFIYTGNKELLIKNYEYLKNKSLITLAREDKLISTITGKVNEEFLKSINFSGKGIEDIVDWPKGTPIGIRQANNAGPTPEGERDGFEFSNINTVVNSFHYNSLILLAKIAENLGKENDKIFFLQRAFEVRKSINEKLFDSLKGIYNDGETSKHKSLHANMFPLAFDLVPEKNIETVKQFIKSKGMACSVYGAQYFLESLFNVGESEFAISLMNSNSKRSWMNMLNVGSTMTTEAWDEYYKPNLTWNHAWGSAPVNIIPRKLVGIEPIEPGFKKFRIVPQIGNLSFVKLKLPTIRGEIYFELFVKNNEWNLTLTIPGNTKSELFIPSIFTEVKINSFNKYPEKQIFFAGENKNIFSLESGTYSIIAKK
ncbi:MAG: alpha-L-rhamnosidase [Ignavibacteriae bacterium]|nr:alpha-L-rhamnosidase [Ignavibacteriota bacterium]